MGTASEAPLSNDSRCGWRLRPVAQFHVPAKGRSAWGEWRSAPR
jgi:hypothetical protein